MKRVLALLVLAGLALTLAAPVAAQQPKVLNLAFTQEPDALPVPMYSNMFFSALLTPLWNSPAWVYDENLNLIPRLVTEIPSADNGGISADGTVITLKLRDDIVWSDGTPITADDFVFTYDMFMAESNAVTSRSPYDRVTSVEAPDPQTVVVTFAEPYAPWQPNLYNLVLPKHILQPVFDAEGTLDGAAFLRQPEVSSGPFVVTEWNLGNYILFSRNDNYFDEKAKLDQIYVRFVSDDAQVAALLNGEADLGTFFAPDDAVTLEQNGITVITVPSGYNEGIFFNFRDIPERAAIQDLAVRQAIAYGLNRDGIARDLLRYGTGPDDYTPIADTYWHNTPWANPAIKHQPYDPDRARQILEEAGWVDTNGDGIREKDGMELKLTWASNQRSLRARVREVGQQQLREIGIEIEIVSLPSDVYFGSYGDGSPVAMGEFDMWEHSNNTAWPDPDVVQWTCAEISSDDNPSGVNDQGLCDPELDRLFNEQARTVDFEARRELFYQIQQIMHDNVYWLPMWHDPDLYALSPRFKNARIAGQTQFWNAADWDIE